MIGFIFFLLIIFIIIALFAFPQFSPIPYFPSNKKDLKLILKALELKNDQIVFDLGAGDGIVIFATAKEAFEKRLNTKFIATEINPILLFILHLRHLLHSNRKNIKIFYSDMFNSNIKNQISKIKNSNSTIQQFNNLTIYLYISPWYLEKTLSNIRKQIKNFKLVSYMYPIKSLEQSQQVIEGVNRIFIYNIK